MRVSETHIRRDSRLFEELCAVLLRRGNAVQFRVNGQSMQPNLQDGDDVVVAPASVAQLRRGDVVLARGEEQLKVHRVERIDAANGQVITRGDSGQENDEPTDHVLGRVVAAERNGETSTTVGALALLRHSSRTFLHRVKLSSARHLKKLRSANAILLLLLAFGAFFNAAPAQGQSLTITDNAAPTTVAPTDTITYTQVLSNTSGVTVTRPITVTQNLPANTTFVSAARQSGTGAWTCNNAAGVITCTLNTGTTYTSGSSTTFRVVVTVNSGVANGTVITDTVSAKGNNTSTVSNSANVTVQAADLSMTQSAAPNPVGTGANITYTETVTNNGPTTSYGATLTQSTPANTTFVSAAAAAGWTCATVPAVGGTGTITCTANAAMNSGTTTGNFSLVVAVNPAAPGGSTITNTATVSETDTDPTPGNNTTSTSVTVSGADLSMTQTVSAPAVATGSTITYTETVTNNGPNAAVTAVVYQQTPPNTTFSSVTPPTGWTCGTKPAVGGTGQVICTDGSNLNSGATTTNLTFVVTVAAGTAAGTTIVNLADVTSQSTDPNPSNNATSTSTVVEVAGNSDLALAMTAAPTPVFISSALSYTIQVTNRGLAAGTGVAVTDTLPATLAGVTATTTQGSCGAPSGGTITCNLGTVAYPLGAPIIITVSGTAPASPGTLTNVASVSTTGTDPVAANNSSTVMTVVQPLVCATPGKDGTPGAPLTGVVNTYYAGSGSPGAGTTSLTVKTPSSGSATQIAVGDLLLVMQMQGAQINSTNTNSYGDNVPGDPASGSTNLSNSGQFEFVTVTAVTTGSGTNTLTISGTGANGGLLNTYASVAASAAQGIQTFQVIRVPQYSSATLSSTLAALPWNGAVGGVLALDVASQLTLGGTVSLDGQGFRGAGGRILTGGTGAGTDDVTLSTNNTNGSKGEGIAGTPHYVAPALSTITPATTATSTAQSYLEGLPNGSYARGAPANAGGGATDANPPANDQNSGGGAGGNGGTGGIGGFGWSTAGLVGGFGGVAFPASTSAVVMGGGGGAGTTNNGSTWDPTTNTGNSTSTTCPTGCTGIYSSGTAGGGIFIVHAGSITGTGTISANGLNALQVENDGGGGGGAGGSILVYANSGSLGGLAASAAGGDGGVTWPENTPGTFPGNRHGPGAGGGGGVIFSSFAPGSADVSGGIPGWTTLANDPYGATAGQDGVTASGIAITETPGTQAGAYCAGADLTVTNSGSPSIVLPGGTITYTQTVTNNGPFDAVNAVFSENIPANTSFQSITPPPPGWTCTTPAVGGVGTITCNDPSVANGASGTFTVVVAVGNGTPSGTQIVDVDTITSGTTDPNLANNTATVVTTVSTATGADLSVVNTPSAPTVPPSTNFTMTAVVKNLGPAVSAGAVFTEATASDITGTANATFVSLAPPAGWVCATPGVGATGTITCTATSLAVGATATFPVVMQSPAAATGTVLMSTANITATTPDPNTGNNSSTASITIANTNQADLAVTSSDAPDPVTQGNNITYTQSITNNGPLAITAGATTPSVTFTDTIPANTTLASAFAPPAGWTCNPIAVGGTGTFTCTLNNGQTLAVGAVVNFPLVVKVNLATAPGTTITNTASIMSFGVTDPNLANNTATDTTLVASPTQADVSIIKTASPEPVNQGTNLSYTLIVKNGGPAVAQSVVVTDPIPAQVTYSSSQTTAGTCTYSAVTTTVSCNIGNLSVGSTVVITINVNAAVFSSSTLSTNTATVSASTTDPNASNNTSSFTSTIQSPTAVDLASFNAYAQPDGTVRLVWRTHEESRNLGFHIYREDGAGRHRVDPSLIAGSALILRGSRPQHAAKSYAAIDAQPAPNAAYWLEDVDINGTRTLHGPVYAETASAEQVRSVVGVQTANALAVSPSLSQFHANVRLARIQSRPLWTPPPAFPSAPSGTALFNAADHAGVKISVEQEGWYHVSFSQLFAAGLSPYTDVRSLHLYAEGIEQPLLLVGHSAGLASASDAIEFYGTGIDTPYSADRVYWLISENSSGKRVLSVSGASDEASSAVGFPFTVMREDRTVYFAALLNGENNDNFFGDVVSSDPVNETLTVAHKDVSSVQPATLELTLQGATDAQQHSVAVQFNGAEIGTFNFYGLVLATQSFSIDSSLIVEGTNSVTLTALDGDNDVSAVQSVKLQYLHTYTADANWLRATAQAGTDLHISGFSNPQIRVFDVTDPLNIFQVNGKIVQESGAYSVNVALPGSPAATRTILALSAEGLSSPVALEPHKPTLLTEQRSGADIVIVSHPDFVDHLAPLVRLRESQGHRVTVVTTDKIFDDYNNGERSPFAVRSFLQDASSRWQRKPQAVLFVGDASMDPRNYLGFGDFDFVPTRMIETAAFKTASDDWFTDFKQTGYATIPTGRLPVRTAADIDLLVSKIVNYEQGADAGSWNNQALLIADQNIDSNFTSAVTSAAATLPSSLQSSQILANGMDPATARAQILAALNKGALLVNYNGHGAEQQWSFAELFNTDDATALTNGSRLPVYVIIDCLNGLFQDVYAESLAESLILAPNGGAVAVWASSGFTEQPPQVSMNLSLLHQLAASPNDPLGALILRAKNGTTDNDVRRTWILFGDPAMKFHFAPHGSSTSGPGQIRRFEPPRKLSANCPRETACPKENQ